ncbi:MAG: hypothetical protein K6C13_08475 [Oscillospiraceae bacterium]|nr:hypothetical protein [Oscillospiraceae bacterium]
MKKNKIIICMAVILLTTAMTACSEKGAVAEPAVTVTSAAPETTVSETSAAKAETVLSETETVTETSASETAAAEETAADETGAVPSDSARADISDITGKWYYTMGDEDAIIWTLTVNDDGSYVFEQPEADFEDDITAEYGTVKAEYDTLGRIFVFTDENYEDHTRRAFLFNDPDSQWLDLELDSDHGADYLSTISMSRDLREIAEDFRNDRNEHFSKLFKNVEGNWETVSFTDANGNTFEYDLNDPVHRSYYIGISVGPMSQPGLIIGTVGHPAGDSYYGNRIDIGLAVLNTTVSRQFEISDDFETMKVCVIADGSITATMKRVDDFSIDEYKNNNSGLTAEDYSGVWCCGNTYITVNDYESPVEIADGDYEGADGDHLVVVTEKLSPEESIEWEYVCYFREQTGILCCEGYGKCTDYYCDAEGKETVTEIYNNGTGFFELRDGNLFWTDYKENAGFDRSDTDGFYRLS